MNPFTFNWNTFLAPEETVQKEFFISPRYLQVLLTVLIVGSFLLCFANIFAGIVVFFLGGLYYVYMQKAKHYALTNKRIVFADVFFGTNITSIDYNQITDIEIEQSVIDQMGHWGALVINTAGTNSPQFRLSSIDQPQIVKQTLDEIRDKQKISVTVSTEPISS